MLLTLSTTHQPATDLGFVLMKHPERVLERELPFGKATVFYPEASARRCTVALLLEVDPVALSRTTRAAEGKPLEPYVNDRPYAAGSFMAVALRDAFGTAMTGTSRERPELADTPLALSVEVPCIAARGPADLPGRLFGPLGYAVQTEAIPLDPLYPEWGERPYLKLRLSGTMKIAQLLKHLYVLLPVLDGRKHYYLNDTEVDKLLRHGEGWLATHPERELIAARYLRFRELVRQATPHFTVQEETVQDGEQAAGPPETGPRLHDARLDAVAQVLRDSGARRVLDLGCGEGKLLRRLLPAPQFRELVGLDISARTLEIAAENLKLQERPELSARVKLLHGSLAYPDSRLKGFDAAALVEVIEHLEPHRLDALSANLFGFARPATVVLTTPNAEYNETFGNPRDLRHRDHRFEWTRAEFQAWATAAAGKYGYSVRFGPLGNVHPEYGPITQMAVFTR
ncbi:3' terminal RNA ribose 2'-O-methyltransferase Hen1 [Deinococcus cavernae]|uniref:Small RNA 2'-O-methyltransferase n=1 Tax=Deinococcus cavernae TaxID=2320857 RepID=A0A418V824_9DEIO|nr:3' terminal RNA ribose 2'-O-methyltransferase Hen1 [Deinococcus cavernae]RJF72245.1 3' terminal RNA ribose 2'-O-methyltransferase Hen1 [Deinococcus cavernae]